MLALTKKRHTDRIKVTLEGPAGEMMDKLFALLQHLLETPESVPWRDAFPEYSEDDLPGVALAGARAKEGLTQKQLSEFTGIPQRHISEMENSKRSIGKERAKKLAKALNVSYKIFL